MYNSVTGDFKPKAVVLLLCGQDTINEEISSLEVIRFECQLFDGVSSGRLHKFMGTE